jgi:hypothetical protein
MHGIAVVLELGIQIRSGRSSSEYKQGGAGNRIRFISMLKLNCTAFNVFDKNYEL